MYDTLNPKPPRARALHPGMVEAEYPQTASDLDPEGRRQSRAITGELWHFDTNRVLGWLRRGIGWLIAGAVLGAVLGLIYVNVAKPRFTAQTDILIDPSNLRVVTDDLYAQNQQRDSQLLEVESKLRILTSGNTLGRVVSALHLADDEEFVRPAMFNLGALFDAGSAATQDEAIVALRSLAERVRAKREDRSFIVTLSVSTEQGAKSVLIADAIVTAFKEELAQAEADGAGRTAKSLIDRLGELKDSVKDAEDRVEAFKRAHDLQLSGGELVSTMSMAQLNTQVLEAQNRLIAARARYDELSSANQSDANIDALQSATITALRTQHATLQQQYDADRLTLGPRHPKLRALAPQIAGLQQLIASEIARVVVVAKTELDAAHSELDALNVEWAGMQSNVFSDNEAQVQLRELEREAAAQGAIYEAFMTRAREVAEREQINTANVRVISPAMEPLERSWPPRTVLVVGAGLVGGLLLGGLLAAAFGLHRDARTLKAAVADRAK